MQELFKGASMEAKQKFIDNMTEKKEVIEPNNNVSGGESVKSTQWEISFELNWLINKFWNKKTKPI